MQSFDPQTEAMKWRFKKYFFGLIVMQCAYFTLWVVITLIPGYSKMIQQWMATSNIFNFSITLLDLMLYMYTIRMLRLSISKCVSF